MGVTEKGVLEWLRKIHSVSPIDSPLWCHTQGDLLEW